MAVYTAGSVEVKVQPDLDGFHKAMAKVTNTYKKIKVELDVDTKAAETKLTSLTKPRTVNINVDVDKTKAAAALKTIQGALEGPNRGIRTLMLSATQASVALVALGGAANMIGGLGSALAAASGAALLLPGAIGAGIAAAAALKLGISGIGDAFSAVADGDAKKFEESLKGLAPSAQGLLRAVWGLRGAFSDLQQSVQGALFNNLAAPFQEMAAATLPSVRAGLTGIADEFNTIARRAMLFFTQAGVIRDMNTSFGATREIIRNLGEALTPIMRVFSVIAAVGLTVIADMTSGIGEAAQNFAAFIDQAAKSGQLEQWIRNGVSAFGDLFAVIGNVGAIIGQVFTAAGSNGVSLFAVLRDVTGEVRSFLSSADGQNLLSTVFGALHATIDAVRPALANIKDVFINLVDAVAPNLPGIGSAFSNIVDALRPFADILTGLVSVVLPPLTWFLQNVAPLLAAMAVPVLVVVGAMRAWAFATGLVTAAQVLLNAAWAANPIGLIITAIVVAIAALVGGFIWAYNNVEWFRDGVNAALEGVKTAVKAVGDFFVWLWQAAIVPAWDAIVAAFQWAWSVISPILAFIWDALKFLGAIIFTVLVAPFVIAFNLIAAAATWLWDNALKPAFDFIAAGWQLLMDGINWAWLNILKPVWDAVAAAANWLWVNILKPVFDFIGNAWRTHMLAMQWAYNNILKPAWDALGTAARWLWDNVLKPVFDAIGNGWRRVMDGINWVWMNILKPCFDAVGGAVHAVGQAFDSTVNWIRDVWNTIKGILAKPINFVIDTVYNNGIKKTWDTIAGWLKIPGLPHVAPIQEFATGGGVRDITGGGKIPGSGNRDTVPGMLMPGEYVFSKKAVQTLGMDNLHAAHLAARSGGVQQFARGGAVHTWPQMWNIAKSLGVNARKTSDYRPGDSGYHGKGQAIDLAGGNFSAIAQALYGKFPNATQIISAQWRGGTGVLNGRNHFYAKDNADHWDHVHWAMTPEALAGAGGGGGGFFDIAGLVVDWFRNTLMKPVMDSAGGLLSKFGDNAFTSGVTKIPGQALEAGTNWVKSKANEIFQFIGGIFGGGSAGPGSGPVVDQVRAVASRFGWGQGGQWGALSRLIQKESSWNPNAQNPTSTAYGLFQFLNSTWGTVGGSKTGNAGQQAEYGLRYIKQRYGSPAGALAFHNKNNWYAKGGPVNPLLYDNGGVLPPTPNGYSLYANHTGKPEAVLTNEQMGWLRNAAAGDGRGIEVNNYLTTRVDSSPESIAQAVTRQAKRSFRGA